MFLSIFGDEAFGPYEEWAATFIQQRHFAAFFGVARKNFLQEGVERGTEIIGNEEPEATVHQPGTLHSEQARPGQVHLPNRPLAVEIEVARRGKAVEVGGLG